VLKEIIANQFVGEDKPILEAQQKMMGTTDLFSLKPVFLPQDMAAVRVRRKIEAMRAEENQ
jgi:vanillate O-demethylase monooxygenase subunit